MQVCKFTSVQVCKSASVQVCKKRRKCAIRAQVCNRCASVQAWKCAIGVQVYKCASIEQKHLNLEMISPGHNLTKMNNKHGSKIASEIYKYPTSVDIHNIIIPDSSLHSLYLIGARSSF